MTNTKRKDESAFKDEHLAKCSAMEEGVLRARSGKQMGHDIPLKKKSDDKEILSRLQELEKEIIERTKAFFRGELP